MSTLLRKKILRLHLRWNPPSAVRLSVYSFNNDFFNQLVYHICTAHKVTGFTSTKHEQLHAASSLQLNEMELNLTHLKKKHQLVKPLFPSALTLPHDYIFHILFLRLQTDYYYLNQCQTCPSWSQ